MPVPPVRKKYKKKNKRASVRVSLLKILFDLAVIFLIITVTPVLVYRLVDPPTTPLLWIRWAESDYKKSHPTLLKHWIPLGEISTVN